MSKESLNKEGAGESGIDRRAFTKALGAHLGLFALGSARGIANMMEGGSEGGEKSEEYEALKKEIDEMFGPTAMLDIERCSEANPEDGVQRYRDTGEFITKDFVGINRDSGKEVSVSAEELREILTNTFPRHWVSGELIGVVQESISKKYMEARGLSPEEYTLTAITKSVSMIEGEDPIDAVIKFSEDSSRYTLEQMLNERLSHEMGHVVDWRGARDLTKLERMKFLISVGKRVISNDRYKSNYVEDIQGPSIELLENLEDWEQYRPTYIENPEKFKNGLRNYLKTIEYWAELCKEYFTNSRKFEKKHPQDFALVEERVFIKDPDFDPEKAEKKRFGIINKARFRSGF